MSETRTLSTVQRTLEVLKAFTLERPEWGVTELAERIGSHKSQVHRILATLTDEGFVVSNPLSRKYRLGPALLRLGMVAEQSGGVVQVVQPVLYQLAQRTGESTVFILAQERTYTIAAAADGPGPIRFALNVGTEFPWYGGAGGHAIFADRSETHIARLLDGDFAEATEVGPHNRDDILQRHQAARDHGYAISTGEYDERVMSIAAPVRIGGEAIGSLCVVGVPELLNGREPQLTRELVDAAEALTERFASRVDTAAVSAAS